MSSPSAPRSFAADPASSGRAHRRVTGARGGQPCAPQPPCCLAALRTSLRVFPLSQPRTKAPVIWREANPSLAVYCGTEPLQLREAPCKAERGRRPALYPGRKGPSLDLPAPTLFLLCKAPPPLPAPGPGRARSAPPRSPGPGEPPPPRPSRPPPEPPGSGVGGWGALRKASPAPRRGQRAPRKGLPAPVSSGRQVLWQRCAFPR